MKKKVYEPIIYNTTRCINLVCNYKTMKPKDKKQFEKELMNYIISKKLHPKESREILRACFEKRIYEKTRKLH